MQLFVYILVYPLLWCISILPFRLLYIISDFLFLLVFYAVGYRKKVVLYNLKLAFPEKSEKELLIIRRKFYKHFIDVFMELIKTFTISEKTARKHYKFTNIELLHDIIAKKKSIMLTGFHYGNWEWIVLLGNMVNIPSIGGYTKIGNKYFDRLIKNSRKKFGGQLVTTKQFIPTIDQNHKKNIQGLYGLLSDQSPRVKRTYYWAPFMGITVPIHTGAEMLSKKYDMSTIFFSAEKVKRGYYHVTFKLLAKDAEKFENYQITDRYLTEIETLIKANPQYYFWTHKRFKHKDKAPEKTN